MLKKPKIKKLSRQERQMPTTIEELIQKYDLDEIWAYIENIIDYINEREG